MAQADSAIPRPHGSDLFRYDRKNLVPLSLREKVERQSLALDSVALPSSLLRLLPTGAKVAELDHSKTEGFRPCTAHFRGLLEKLIDPVVAATARNPMNTPMSFLNGSIFTMPRMIELKSRDLDLLVLECLASVGWWHRKARPGRSSQTNPPPELDGGFLPCAGQPAAERVVVAHGIRPIISFTRNHGCP